MAFLLEADAFFQLALVAVACVQQFARFLGRDVGEFLSALLLVGQALDAVLESLVLLDLLVEDLPLLAHLEPCDHRGRH